MGFEVYLKSCRRGHNGRGQVHDSGRRHDVFVTDNNLGDRDYYGTKDEAMSRLKTKPCHHSLGFPRFLPHRRRPAHVANTASGVRTHIRLFYPLSRPLATQSLS